MHGGVKFYHGAAKAARAYVERDRSRADDYYLGEGTGVAVRLIASPDGVGHAGSMDGETYEQWVAGIDIDTGRRKGRVRDDANALRFVEVTVNGPKTWSLAAALHPEISAVLDQAQDRAAEQIVGWVAAHATTRVGPRGRQVQVPVEGIEAAVIRHYTSRAGDPHRHLHLQINARVWAAGAWRGIHSVGMRDSIEAINGIGHAAVVTDPGFRSVLAAHGFTVDPETSEIRELAPYVGAFSARAGQIRRNVDRYEAEWRSEHPGEEPGRRLREGWDRRAWAQARPDKVVPTDGRELVDRWNTELRELGYKDPTGPVPLEGTRPGWIDRDAAADLVVSILGANRSAWNTADLRGKTEVLLAQTCLLAETAARVELAEDITARAARRCVPLLNRADVPEHVRSLTSPKVLEVEADLISRLAQRGGQAVRQPRRPGRGVLPVTDSHLDSDAVGLLTGRTPLVVIEGAAGAGKTTALRATQQRLALYGHRLLVVTPTLKAAQVAAAETGAQGHSAAWLIHQHGWRWDNDGHWTRHPNPTPDPSALLGAGDLLLVDEAGMLDQDTARALLTIADETGARVAFVGDRHQLPAVGRGGVLDHAITWAHPTAIVCLEKVHRFTDPDYAALSLQMRTGQDPGSVFDALHRRGQVVIHASEAERTAALAEAGATGDLVIADTRDQVAHLNSVIRDHRHTHDTGAAAAEGSTLTTDRGEVLGVGDRVATRRNDPHLQVANRQTWTITGIRGDGSLVLHGRGRDREIPAEYATRFVELAYATTVHGAQGDTVARAHFALDDATGAAAAYVAMTRGREANTAHLVADKVDEARRVWVAAFSRDRADLGPGHARTRAIDDIDRYGPAIPPAVPTGSPRRPGRELPEVPPTPIRTGNPGIGR
jgi:exodeoxyribonuclease V alpha subunit